MHCLKFVNFLNKNNNFFQDGSVTEGAFPQENQAQLEKLSRHSHSGRNRSIRNMETEEVNFIFL
jgi:hypothetical protein